MLWNRKGLACEMSLVDGHDGAANIWCRRKPGRLHTAPISKCKIGAMDQKGSGLQHIGRSSHAVTVGIV